MDLPELIIMFSQLVADWLMVVCMKSRQSWEKKIVYSCDKWAWHNLPVDEPKSKGDQVKLGLRYFPFFPFSRLAPTKDVLSLLHPIFPHPLDVPYHVPCLSQQYTVKMKAMAENDD